MSVTLYLNSSEILGGIGFFVGIKKLCEYFRPTLLIEKKPDPLENPNTKRCETDYGAFTKIGWAKDLLNYE